MIVIVLMMIVITVMMIATIVIMMIIIMIIIITLKGTIREFYDLLTAPRTAFNTYGQVARAQSCASHVQHIERLSDAACCVPRGTEGQLS